MYQKLHESFSDTKRIIPFKYLYQLGMDIETKNNTPAAFPAAVGTKGRYCSNGHQGTHCDQQPKPD